MSPLELMLLLNILLVVITLLLVAYQCIVILQGYKMSRLVLVLCILIQVVVLMSHSVLALV